jgi:hypothetical protein
MDKKMNYELAVLSKHRPKIIPLLGTQFEVGYLPNGTKQTVGIYRVTV